MTTQSKHRQGPPDSVPAMAIFLDVCASVFFDKYYTFGHGRAQQGLRVASNSFEISFSPNGLSWYRVPDFAIANSSRRHFSVGGPAAPPHPLRCSGGAPPPHTPPKSRPSASMGPRSLVGWGPGPKWPWTRIGLGAIWAQDEMDFGEIEKQKGSQLGPRWVHLG